MKIRKRMSILDIPKIKHASGGNFILVAGPCVVENEKMPWEIARHILNLSDELEIPFIFKASYKKANRSRVDSFTGIGDMRALEILAAIGKDLDIPTITDIHSTDEAKTAARYADILQIPAFLCRQTDLLIAAGDTGCVVNIKKGQFASSGSMKYAVEKVLSTGNRKVILTERGTTFGYSDLVVDFRNIPEMQKLDVPVIVDVTHSLQQPNQTSGVTGGRPELIPVIARASVAAGADGLFLETHPDPHTAKSDGANMLRLDLLEDLLLQCVRIRKAISTNQS